MSLIANLDVSYFKRDAFETFTCTVIVHLLLILIVVYAFIHFRFAYSR